MRDIIASVAAIVIVISIIFLGYRNEKNIEKIEDKIESNIKKFLHDNLSYIKNKNDSGDFTLVNEEENQENSEEETNEPNEETSNNSTQNSSLDKESNDSTNLTPSQIEEIVKSYLENNPEIIAKSLDKLQQVRMEEMKKKTQEKVDNRKSDLESPNSPFLGNKDGKSIIVVFYDYNCGYCKQANETLTKLISDNKDLKVVIKLYPILGSESDYLAKLLTAIHIKEPKKFAKIHNILMEDKMISKDDLENIFKKNNLNFKELEEFSNSDIVENKIKENIDIVKELRINGVPAFIINGEYFAGYLNEEQIKAKLSLNKYENSD